MGSLCTGTWVLLCVRACSVHSAIARLVQEAEEGGLLKSSLKDTVISY